ncbi:o-succinylbenzoate synthase [Klugiella xanthotipulae]|uniref:o-succinylbenzoate synthase n=1 Tax=Klugiella xanthotipulae TaxID=244735 RepID=A0A543HZ65_9MICO|nr:o-succinylbenzoate synthase [Klugiella xanthotipulae]TQM63642.1 O-succinylbenzoate synthase [Klugiella xanthotipulae]
MDIPLSDILRALRVVSIPTRTRFRGITTREAALVRGPEGWSEFSPFPEYSDAEAATWLAAAINFGWHPQPAPLRDTVAVNATVPAIAADRVAELLARFPGCHTVKVKVAEAGHTRDDDYARVLAVRRALGEDGNVRVDANGGWSVAEAEAALTRLAPLRLEYAEQPVATVAGLEALRARLAGSGLLIAADESVRKASDPLDVARRRAADILVVKAQPLGGIRAALRIAEQAGLPIVVSSALDTSVGLSMGALLAASLPTQDFAAGLGTAALLAGDVTEHPLLPVGGEIPVSRVTPSERMLDRFAATPERSLWWRERIVRCYTVLAERPAG